MTVREFLLYYTLESELVQICSSTGCNVAMCFIDRNYSFIKGIPEEILNKKVISNRGERIRHRSILDDDFERSSIRIVFIEMDS